MLPFDERLRALDDERPFAVVRLRPPPDEPLPFDELLPRLDELLLRLDVERLREPEDDAFEPPDDDFDRRDEELLRRELDDELLRFFTSPSSMTPRQAPVSSSSITA